MHGSPRSNFCRTQRIITEHDQENASNDWLGNGDKESSKFADHAKQQHVRRLDLYHSATCNLVTTCFRR